MEIVFEIERKMQVTGQRDKESFPCGRIYGIKRFHTNSSKNE